MFPALVWFSALSFLGYGISCLTTRHMRLEFERYGLARFRNIVGVTQVFGGIGLLVGLHSPAIGLVASGGLAFQMLLGVGVRIAIRDSLFQTLPAFLFLVLNGWLFIEQLTR
jgi:uncharacterized membrane protein YkgB